MRKRLSTFGRFVCAGNDVVLPRHSDVKGISMCQLNNVPSNIATSKHMMKARYLWLSSYALICTLISNVVLKTPTKTTENLENSTNCSINLFQV